MELGIWNLLTFWASIENFIGCSLQNPLKCPIAAYIRKESVNIAIGRSSFYKRLVYINYSDYSAKCESIWQNRP